MKLLMFSCCLPVLLQAELRTIALEIHQAEDDLVKVTVYSDVKEEKQKDVSIADAAEILKKAKGWGSSVELAIITEGAVDLRVYMPLLEAISENAWLNLAILKRKRGLGEHILKHYGIEPPCEQDN